AVWNAAPPSDDQLLIWAVSDLVFRLERDPHNEGESRPQNTRVLISRPLVALFSIPGDDEVRIHSIWRHART
ncbi:MAG: hypothetical protein K2V38_21340, partial [Gemmataceae bacterium]|nr:hypothetical protein [Gemmataceae bacterium]